MKKVLKKFLIVVSVLLILFSIYGGVTELTAEKTDTFGIVLAVIFFFLGAFLLFLGIRRKKVKKPVVVESEDAIKNEHGEIIAVKPKLIETIKDWILNLFR